MVRLFTGAAVVAGAFAVCTGLPLGIVYLLSQLQLDVVPALALGAGLGVAGLVAGAAGLQRLHRLHVRLGPPPPPGLEPGSVLLEASVVIAAGVSVVVLGILFL